MNYEKFYQNQLFTSLNIEEIKNVISHFKEYTYEKKQIIFHEGDKLKTIFIIIDGEVEVHNYDYKGNKIIIALLKNYDMFGESVALSDVEITPYASAASKESKILKIAIEDFKKLLLEYPQLMMNMLELVASKNAYLTYKIEILSKKNIRDRVIEVLKYYYQINQNPCFTIPFNKTRFADFIGINRSALETELTKMINESLFTYDNKKFTLSDKLINMFY